MMEGSGPKVSVLINTLNEEQNLPYALRSVKPWADEVVVVDMYSTDRTVEIAKSFGARVVLHEGPGFNYAPREFAVEQVSHDWIFVLDADEIVSRHLAGLIRELIRKNVADAYLVPRINYICGAAMKGTGWDAEQDAQLRLFKKGKVIASSKAHSDFILSKGAILTRLPFDWKNAIYHFNYLDFEQFVNKLNRYTSIEAQQAYDRRERPTITKALFRVMYEFINRFFRRKGYLDGWRGLYLAGLMAAYRWIVYAKLTQLHNVGDRNQILELYKAEAERILADFELKDERKNVL